MDKQRILVIDDDEAVLSLFTKMLRHLGFEVRTTKDLDEFIAAAEHSPPSLVVIDLQMPDHDGIEVLDDLASRAIQAPIAITSGFGNRVLNSARQYAVSRGLNVAGVLPKPIELEQLRELVASLPKPAHELSIEALRQAVRNKELTVFYQPKVSLADKTLGEVSGFEALLRWQHPELGLIAPNRFIPLAEERGLIPDITEKVLATAVEQLLTWNASGPERSMAINLSPAAITNRHLSNRLCEIVRSVGLDPRLVIMELTEGAAMKHVTRPMEILMRLRLCGFELAIDDFGTGYSSLKKLHRMPFSELKIDRSFVQPLGTTDTDAGVIVNALVDLARNLSMSVCAEGVETLEACRILRRLRCETMQGFLASRALPSDEMTAWLQAWEPESFARQLEGDGGDTICNAPVNDCKIA